MTKTETNQNQDEKKNGSKVKIAIVCVVIIAIITGVFLAVQMEQAAAVEEAVQAEIVKINDFKTEYEVLETREEKLKYYNEVKAKKTETSNTENIDQRIISAYDDSLNVIKTDLKTEYDSIIANNTLNEEQLTASTETSLAANVTALTELKALLQAENILTEEELTAMTQSIDALATSHETKRVELETVRIAAEQRLAEEAKAAEEAKKQAASKQSSSSSKSSSSNSQTTTTLSCGHEPDPWDNSRCMKVACLYPNPKDGDTLSDGRVYDSKYDNWGYYY